MLLPINDPGVVGCREKVADQQGIIGVVERKVTLGPRLIEQHRIISGGGRRGLEGAQCHLATVGFRHIGPGKFTIAGQRATRVAPRCNHAFGTRQIQHGFAGRDKGRAKGGMLITVEGAVKVGQVFDPLLHLYHRFVPAQGERPFDPVLGLGQIGPIVERNRVGAELRRLVLRPLDSQRLAVKGKAQRTLRWGGWAKGGETVEMAHITGQQARIGPFPVQGGVVGWIVSLGINRRVAWHIKGAKRQARIGAQQAQIDEMAATGQRTDAELAILQHKGLTAMDSFGC